MVSRDISTPSCALAIGAHPDDVEFGCGATLAKWASKGCKIYHLICTDGSKGSWDPDTDVASLIARRKEEQRRASRALGGSGEVIFLSWPDGELEAGLRQRWQICWWIRKIRPEVILGHDPWKRYRLHPDHRNAGFLFIDATVAARDPLFFPEQNMPPHRPSALLLFEADEPNHIEDVTGFEELKVAALLEHKSQLETTMGIPVSNNNGSSSSENTFQDIQKKARDEFVTKIKGELASNGKVIGVRSGESFYLMDNIK